MGSQCAVHCHQVQLEPRQQTLVDERPCKGHQAAFGPLLELQKLAQHTPVLTLVLQQSGKPIGVHQSILMFKMSFCVPNQLGKFGHECNIIA